MSKQTAEQTERAAAYFAVGKGKNTEELMLLMQGFVGGSSWRSQQGIEWVSVAEKGLPPAFKDVLCASQKGRIVISCVDADGEIDGYPIDEDDKFTHYALLNLPKTDK